MDHMRILQRAFAITRDYRALWVFGILLALTSGGGGGSPGGGGSGGGNGSSRSDVPFRRMPNFENLPWNTIWTVVAVVFVVLILVGIAFALVRSVAETAAVRMVNERESGGEKMGVREGLRLGWSRRALRIFMIDLIFGLGGLIVFLVILSIALTPLLLWATDQRGLGVLGTAMTVGLSVLVIFLAVVVGIGLALVMPFMHRAVALEDRGVLEGIGRGFALVRRKPWDIFVMGLILFGLGLGWAVVMAIVVLMLFLIGAVVGGVPALLVGWTASQWLPITTSWMVAAVVGMPLLVVIVVLPALFLNGLAEIFRSSVWTLTYREVLAVEK